MKWLFANRWFYHIARSGFAILTAFIVLQFPLYYLESYFYDLRVRLSPRHQVSGRVVPIAITPETIELLKRTPSPQDHEKLLTALLKEQPAAVVYLFPPKSKCDTQSFETFAKLAGQFPHFLVNTNDLIVEGQESEMLLPPPLEKIPVVFGPRTEDSDKLAGDGVTRRMIVTMYEDPQPTLHVQLHRLIDPSASEIKYPGIFQVLDSTQVLVDFAPRGTYPLTSFHSVMNQEFPPGTFKGKIVFVGLDTETEALDYVRTPFERGVLAMSVLELHANMMDTLILNSSPVRMPPYVNFILTALVALIISYAVLALKPAHGLFILIAVVVGFCLFAQIAFIFGHHLVSMAHPLLATFICYYFLIPYRLIMENRRSWEYYQKNKLLTQVEELKTNFISMMSHDLRTPLARIQGMTDLALKGAPLSERQKEALNVIQQSGQELTQFIESILDLGRIESKEIKLRLASKDVNVVIQEVIRKFDFMIKAKNIKVETQLEPLFSIRIDIDLIRQVFSNLLENAVKYSSEGKRIWIRSEESDGKIRVIFKDEGVGIPSEELTNIFLKFYRSKDVKNSKIKGSGLGLYLANYFVQLHSGTISVESGVNVGSEFVVELPTNL